MTDPGEPRAPETPGGMLSVGDVVSDRYRIDAVLGEGGMGIVYRAEHLHLHKPHALKVLLPAWSSMSEVVARFEREAVAAGRIESPHVAAATDFGTLPDGSFFLVMEYVDGRTLRSALDEGPLEPVRAVHILRGIVSGLGVAHAIGVVHRDLKPENVMLVARDGDPDFVKVLDFGVARIDAGGGVAPAGPSQPLTMVGAVIGTPDYMSPEQALGQRVDARSDLYSVGVILFEMLTGRCPFEGGAVTVLRQHVTAELPELSPVVTASLDPRIGVILRRLLAKLPEDRFASTADLTAALDACTDECGPAPRAAAIRRTEAVEPLLRYAPRGRVTAAIIVVAVSLGFRRHGIGPHSHRRPGRLGRALGARHDGLRRVHPRDDDHRARRERRQHADVDGCSDGDRLGRRRRPDGHLAAIAVDRARRRGARHDLAAASVAMGRRLGYATLAGIAIGVLARPAPDGPGRHLHPAAEPVVQVISARPAASAKPRAPSPPWARRRTRAAGCTRLRRAGTGSPCTGGLSAPPA